MSLALAEPMLATPTKSRHLPPGCAAEPKWDGFRALLAREIGRPARIVSRRGNELTPAFPEIVEAAAALPESLGDVVLDGELVIWNEGRLDFQLLLHRHGRGHGPVSALAATHPAHYIAFDLLHVAGFDITHESYDVRREALEKIFGEHALGPPFTLCPSSSDPREIDLWLTAWTEFGVEGLCFKRRDQTYLAGRRGWTKYRLRDSSEVVLGAVTGSLRRPEILHVGVPDAELGLRYIGRTTPIGGGAAREVAEHLKAAGSDHPWQGTRPTPAFEPAAEHPTILVEPTLVVELTADAVLDARGRWRVPATFIRPRPDLTVRELLPAGAARGP